MLTWTSGQSDVVFQNFTWIYIVIHCLEEISNRKKSTEFYCSILIWQALQRLHLQNICLWTCFWFAMVVIIITVGSLTIELIFFSPNLMQCSHKPAVSEVHLVITSVSQYTLSDERKRRFAYWSKTAILLCVFFFSIYGIWTTLKLVPTLIYILGL